tara:strand:+ start:67 stop:498 length:432 start_codon:yes stop_codon:yes gene_type:complete
MKNIASILVFVFAFALTTGAQQKRKVKRDKLSVEQRTELAVKKMTLALNLSDKQQNEIKPLLVAQAKERKVALEKRKALRDSNTKPTKEELYAMRTQQLDAQIDFKSKMKAILKTDQFERFEKMSLKRKQKGRKMMKGKRERK